MSTALGYIYDIYENLIDFIFNDLEFFNGVTFGWVVVTCSVFVILIKNILAMPRSAHGSIRLGGKKDE